ncbi:hypothetical protein ACHAWC_009869, partial [Mediolabrus comicus]
MGKKSKKKGGGGAASKAARKEKLQERREQQLEQLDQYYDDDDDGGDNNNELQPSRLRREREYFVGDRVWVYWDCMRRDNPNTYRGIVQSVDGDFVEVKPLQSFIDGSDFTTERVSTKVDYFNVFPDFCDMTLRFDVGDKVMARIAAQTLGGYVPATVDALWAIGELRSIPSSAGDLVPHYSCSKEFEDESKYCTAPEDTDDWIRRVPTSFRLKVGDDVTFNTATAGGISAAASNYLRRYAETASWIPGKVTKVKRHEVGMYCAAYECSFQVGAKSYSCLIYYDDDESIALANADPRKRLFDAIEQDCSRLHFIYLTTHFKIDIAAFRDLVVTKVIEFASYDALAWLQNDCKFSLKGVKDEGGNNFLHMIAKSPFAARFIRKAGSMSLSNSNGDVEVKLMDYGYFPTKELNNNGEIWLQILVHRGDVKALDAAFSPHHGLGWKDLLFYEDQLQLVAESIKKANNPIMECIFNSYVSFRKLYTQYNALSGFSFRETEEQQFDKQEMAIFKGDDAEEAARRLTRFYLDWKDYPPRKLNNGKFMHLAQKGWSRLFRLLYGADQRLWDKSAIAAIGDYGHWEQEGEGVTVDVFTACILGEHHCLLPYEVDFDGYGYVECVRDHFVTCEHKKSGQTCPSLHHHLHVLNALREQKENNYRKNDCISYRLRLLQDENDVEGRREILEYLLDKHTDVRPDALLAMKNRQGWALRFIVEKKHLDLEAGASADKNLSKNASTFSFLDSGRIPSTMTTRYLLCFAAVQFDDMQSLQWLCESSGPPTELIGGWNLLHYSAYMGRIEIIGWLSTLPVWDSLVSQPCERKPFHGAFAVHISASCGHINVCDLLIDLNVELEDKKGKLPEDYAKKSRHKFVREWAADRAKPQALEKDIKKLFHLIEEKRCALQQIKDFITASKCLEIDTWKSCDCYSYDENGPMGLSLGQVLHKCCENSDIQLATWLCIRYYFHESSYSSYNSYCYSFWGHMEQKERIIISQDYLVSFADERGYDELVNQLQRPWFKDVSCSEPLTKNFMLVSALSENEHLVDVRDIIFRIDLLLKVIKAAKKSMREILERGGRVDALGELFSIHSSAIKAVSGDLGDACKDEQSNHFSDVSCTLEPITIDSFYLRATNKVDPVSNIIRWSEEGSLERDPEFLAVQGYTELLQFCLTNLPGWTATLELNIVRIASFFGHSTMVDMLLSPTSADMLLSDSKDRRIAAVLGAGQALRYNDLVSFTTMYGAIPDSIKGKGRDEEENCEEKLQVIDSLLYAVITGYVVEGQHDDEVDNKETLRTLSYLVEHLSYTHDDILYVVGRVLDRKGYIPGHLLSVIDLLWSIIDKLGLHPACYLKQMQKICMIMVKECRGDKSSGELLSKVFEFIGRISNAGMDIEVFDEELSCYRENELSKKLTKLKQKQVTEWSQFDLIKKGGSLEDIQKVIADGGLTISSRDRGGLLLTHLSAAYDRLDLLEWLVVKKGMDLDLVDGQRRSTLDVAKASKAAAATKWIIEWKANSTIQNFLRRNFYRARNKRRMQRLNRAAVVVQSNIRGYATRKIYASVLMSRMEESQRFIPVWGHVIASLNSNTMTPTSWVGIREQLIDIKVGLDDETLDETDQRLSRAVEGAVQEESEVDDLISNDVFSKGVELDEDDESITEAMHDDVNTNQQWLSFQMTSHVVKFLQQGDKKYRSFFVRRMRQLAAGERSRILQKPLKGSKSIIYETYLEQKSGHRILWTEEKGGKIVIWYVAKHKQVSRLMQLIDDSKSRSARQQMPQALMSELQNESYTPPKDEPRREVLLDIFNNVPLKIYDVNFNTINEIAKEYWTPKLHLTDEERDIVQAEGTVLVLGRSGTGKTICICNRIEYDRQTGSGQDPLFTQLFVARSLRLCRYVEGAVGEDNRTSFTTYERLLSDIESTLPAVQTKHFNPSQRMDFSRFRRDFHSQSSSKEKIGALILWS